MLEHVSLLCLWIPDLILPEDFGSFCVPVMSGDMKENICHVTKVSKAIYFIPNSMFSLALEPDEINVILAMQPTTYVKFTTTSQLPKVLIWGLQSVC